MLLGGEEVAHEDSFENNGDPVRWEFQLVVDAIDADA